MSRVHGCTAYFRVSCKQRTTYHASALDSFAYGSPGLQDRPLSASVVYYSQILQLGGRVTQKKKRFLNLEGINMSLATGNMLLWVRSRAACSAGCAARPKYPNVDKTKRRRHSLFSFKFGSCRRSAHFHDHTHTESLQPFEINCCTSPQSGQLQITLHRQLTHRS